MKANRRILLYGNSVILGSIGASLRQCSQFEVTTCESPHGDPRVVEALKPDILLFDLEATQTEEVFSFLENDRAVVLMGISPDINLVKVWSGRQLREISTRGLLEVIHSEMKDLQSDPIRASHKDHQARELSRFEKEKKG
jgi:hypothetical protein